MPTTQDGPLLDALLDSWDRNNTILINLLRALPEEGMDLRAADGSPTVAELFMHIHDEEIGQVTWDVWMEKGR